MPAREDFEILLLTIRVAAVSTAVILPLAVFSAWLLSRSHNAFSGIVETLLSLPLVLPPTAVGFFLLEILRRDSIVGRVLGAAGIEMVFTWKAAVLASAVMSFPLLVRPIWSAFEEIDQRLLDVARTLGLSPLAIFGRVLVPMAWRGIVTGTLLAFSRALGEFGATVIVAGNIPGRTQTLALAIFQRAELGQQSAATALVLITVVLAFVVIWTTGFLSRRDGRRLPARRAADRSASGPGVAATPS